ncbi:MCP four helix bundle domain-containing protein [Candidatus Marithioploca araucensis]|uniref:MCP four helix bundle domain-containing protein n=1 Tax=Candidatus Marithioploca araucensis TaxID=70273 RepID=A0ABT7VTW7_9GAMM|nr:MCP four helix bundle domain-containing protein [Candidatus Marithioploca araucensis]
MKKFLIGGMIAIFAMQWVQAETICDVRIALADARFNLMMMVVSTEKAEQEALKVEIDKASTALEKVIAAMLKDENKTDDAQLTTLQDTWKAFKKTRETEIVPAIYAGDNMKAIEIATGVQAERMNTMDTTIQALNGDNCN